MRLLFFWWLSNRQNGAHAHAAPPKKKPIKRNKVLQNPRRSIHTSRHESKYGVYRRPRVSSRPSSELNRDTYIHTVQPKHKTKATTRAKHTVGYVCTHIPRARAPRPRSRGTPTAWTGGTRRRSRRPPSSPPSPSGLSGAHPCLWAGSDGSGSDVSYYCMCSCSVHDAVRNRLNE